MRPIDADVLKQKLQNVANKAKGKRMIAKLDEVMEVLIKHLDDFPTIKPDRKPASIGKIAMMLHELYGCSVLEGVKAHDIALEYLRDKAMLKG